MLAGAGLESVDRLDLQALQEGLVERRQDLLAHLEHFDGIDGFLAGELGHVKIGREGNLHVLLVALRNTGDLLAEAGDQALVTLDLFPSLWGLAEDGAVRYELGHGLVADLALVGELHVVGLLGGALHNLEIGALGAHALDRGVDLGIGHVDGGDLGLETLVFGKLELGAQVDGERDGGRQALLDHAFLQVDQAEHLELRLLEAVLIGLVDDLGLELALDLLGEALLDDRRRDLAGPEAGQARDLRDFSHHRA
jgi:hypothetical protein